MLSNGQTLVHKETKQLARLVPEPGEVWAWTIGKHTVFVNETGVEFVDDIKKYTHIEDELGRPYAKQPKEGQFVDESAKKYLVNEKTLAEMREVRLKEWEANILERMKNEQEIISPFADGSMCPMMFKYFMQKRNAKPLYRKFNNIRNEFRDGPLCFKHKGKYWMYNMNDLFVIKPYVEKKTMGLKEHSVWLGIIALLVFILCWVLHLTGLT